MGIDLFADLLTDYMALPKGPEKRAMAFDLLPYVAPKLKSMELKGDLHTTVTVAIGGTPSASPEGAE